MDDFLEQVARRRHQGVFTLMYVLMWVVIVISGFSALMYLMSIMGVDAEGNFQFNFIALIFAVVFGGIAFLLWRRADYCKMEYDYSFTNGTLDVSRVLNNKRRRYLTALDMKDVVRCGPAKGPAFVKTLNEPNIKKHNWFLNRDNNLCYFYFVKNSVKHIIVVEPSDEMVEMAKPYLNYGVWHG